MSRLLHSVAQAKDLFAEFAIVTLLFACGVAQAAPPVLYYAVPATSKAMLSGSLTWLYEDFAVDGPVVADTRDCGELASSAFFKSVANETTCYSFKYQVTDFETHALLLRAAPKTDSSRRKLVVYNHGHGGAPNDQEHYAQHFLKESLKSGIDVLLVSMPFTGIDKTRKPIRIKTWDGWTTLEPSVLNDNPTILHGVFETLDTGRSHYMRIFIDSAVLGVLSLRDSYDEFYYVGLSGGATVGLYTCSLLTRLMDACFLIAGVMPLTHRLTPANFGDAEQISGGFHKRQKTLDLIKEIYDSPTSLFLSYNSHDPCCFGGESARRLEDDLNGRGISGVLTIRESFRHDYDPDLLLATIVNWRSKRLVQ